MRLSKAPQWLLSILEIDVSGFFNSKLRNVFGGAMAIKTTGPGYVVAFGSVKHCRLSKMTPLRPINSQIL